MLHNGAAGAAGAKSSGIYNVTVISSRWATWRDLVIQAPTLVVVLLLFGFLDLSCQSRQISLEQKKIDLENKTFQTYSKWAILYFFRSTKETGYVFDDRKFKAYLDDVEIGVLGGFSYLKVLAKPGKHRLKFYARCGYEEYDVVLNSGKIYFWGERHLNDRGKVLGPYKSGIYGGGCLNEEYMREYDETIGQAELNKCEPQL